MIAAATYPPQLPTIGYTAHSTTAGHGFYNQRPSTNGADHRAQKRWTMPMANVAALMANQMTPSRAMTELCAVALGVLYPNMLRSGERVEMRRFIQAILESSAVSADVVLLALYYLRQTAESEASVPLQRAVVVDAEGLRVDGGDCAVAPLPPTNDIAMRIRFVAALTCAHKFDADAAYTTRTWADLGGLDTPALVRAERHLLARLDFKLNVSRDALTHLRAEIERWMSSAASGYDKSQHAFYQQPSQHYPHHAHRVTGVPSRCPCTACAVYPADAVSPTTSPPCLGEAWSPVHDGAVAPYAFDMAWPTTPTGPVAAADDYFTAAHYRQHYVHPATATVVGGTHYYDMPQPYHHHHQAASPVAYAAPTAVIAMPEPSTTPTHHQQHPVWPGLAAYPAQHMSAMADCAFDLAFSHMAAMPQPVAFYAY
ncbi:hypothetical protein THASP1DRAFT_22966 [Thamnocephalis sphaerospora]|uniref:Cyclin N-terminal domain-containing protein n=1 Tax=Thamnocephalis sphaerospora TaxID=78915 RepID=A0A4P9XU93_9FUNG|nr:hypothetical protein THASP1DRAFT_22966 [Thamnocephalis sphaerospora]|eukprot:RKP09151.1 hypothetical protein THASP1DRAFT_22966 [Thamnocephalis sphaerospora]